MGLIDTHAHLYEPVYRDCIDTLMSELTQNGIENVICVGCNIETTQQSIELAEKYPFVYAQAGFHPCDTGDITPEKWERMKQLSRHKKIVAIGEIGLDYHWDSVPRDTQKEWFAKQIDFANECSLPVVIHSREATLDTLEVLRAHTPDKAVFHCYSGSVETLKTVIDMGFYISIGGVVTFKNARTTTECAEFVPLERLMLETDCPYLAPEPFRGKTNRPDYTRFVAEKIADIRGMETDEIINITRGNAKRFFNI